MGRNQHPGAEHVWAVVYTGGGGLAGIWLDRDRAMAFAHATESVVVRLPVWADMRREEDRKGWEHSGKFE